MNTNPQPAKNVHSVFFRPALASSVATLFACLNPAAADTVSSPVVTSPGADTRIFNANWGWNNNDGAGTDIGVYQSRDRSLLRFEFAGLPVPVGATVSASTLTLSVTGTFGGNPNGETMGIYRLTQAWTEGGVTWNNYDGTNAWTAAGGDYDATVHATSTANPSVGQTITWDVTSLAQGWSNGTFTNNGLIIINSGTTNGLHFASKENGTVAYRPYLTTSFVTPTTPPPAAWTWNGGDGAGGAVDGGGTWGDPNKWWNGAAATWVDNNDAVFGAGTGTAGTVTITGTVQPKSLWFQTTGTGNYTLSGGTIDLGAAIRILHTDTDATIGSTLSNGSVFKQGPGKLTLTGSNDYSGATTVSSGTLQVGDGGTNGTLGSGSVTNNGSLVLHRSDDWTVANTIAGTGSLTKQGAGILTLSGTCTFSGATTVNAGTLRATNLRALGPVAIDGSATLAANSTSANTGLAMLESNWGANLGQISRLAYAQRVLAVTNPSYSSATAVDIAEASGWDNHSRLYSGMLKIENEGTYTFSTNSDDGSMLWIDGIEVVNNNYWQGMTTRSGSISLSAGYHNLQIAYMQGGGGYGLHTQFSGPDTGDVTKDLNTTNAQLTPDLAIGSLSGSGSVQLSTGNLITGADGGNSTFSGVISSASGVGAGLLKVGGGTLTLAGSNTFTGTTTLAQGHLRFANPSGAAVQGNVVLANGGSFLVMEAANQFGPDSTLTFSAYDGHSEFALFGHNQTVAGLASVNGYAVIQNSHSGLGSVSANSVLTIDQDIDTTYSGIIRDSNVSEAFTLGLIKTGSGKLTLTSTTSHTGGTAVNGGTLELNANGGNGRIANVLTVNAGGTVVTTGDGTGLGYYDHLKQLDIAGGMVTAANNMHVWNIPGGINMSGGTLQSNNGVSDPAGSQLEWNRATVNVLDTATTTSTIGGRIRMRNDNSYAGIVFNVGNGAAATDLLVSAAVTEASGGLGITKNGGGTMVISGAISYSGNTTVNGGVLSIPGPSLSDTATVSLAAGTVLDLNFSGTDTIGRLVIDGVTVPSGLYDSSVATPLQYRGYFTGTGALFVGAPGPAGNGIWTFLGSGNWSEASNWQADFVANGTDQSATFSQNIGGTITLDGNRWIGSLFFDAADYTLTGASTLTLHQMTGVPTVSVGAGRSAIVSTTLAGPSGLKKAGLGTLTLGASNSFSGGTIVAEGILKPANNQALGASGNLVTVNSGATLDINGATLQGYTEAIRIAGAGADPSLGALGNSGGENMNAIRSIELTDDASIGGNGGRWDIGRVDFDSHNIHIIGNDHVLTKVGSDAVAILGAATGLSGVVINGGNLVPHFSDSLGDAPITVNGGAMLSTWGGKDLGSHGGYGLTLVNPVTLNGGTISTDAGNFTDTYTGGIQLASGGGTLNATNNGNLWVDSAISGTGSLTKTGGNALYLTAANNSYSGVTILEGGTTNVASLSNYGVDGSLGNRVADGPTDVGILFRGGAVQYTGSTPQSTDRAIRLSTTGGGGTIDASGSMLSATLSFTRSEASPDFWENGGARTLTLTGSNAGDNTFAMPIVDWSGVTTINLTKSGSGKWVLTGTNSYLGATTVNSGTLVLAGSGVINTAATLSIGGGGTFRVQDAASATFRDLNIGYYYNNPGHVAQAGGTLTVTGDSGENAAVRIGHWPDETSTYTLSGGSLLITAAGVNLALGTDGEGIFTQTGGWLETPGIVVNHRNGDGNGIFNLEGGTAWVGSNGISSDGGTYTVNLGGGTLGALAAWSSSLNMTLTGINGNTTINTTSGSIALSGALGGTGGLVKAGGGTLTLGGSNTYSGATSVAAGTLAVTGTLGTSAVTVEDGATLAGNGNLGGKLTIRTGGRHALAVAATPAGQVTRLIDGDLVLETNNVLELTAAAPPAPGTYVLATANGTNGISGTPGNVILNGLTGTVAVNGDNLELTILPPGFASWIADPAFNLALDQRDPGDDPDNDGIPNIVEYVLQGGNPSVFTAGIQAPDTSGANAVFTFYRRSASTTDTIQVFQSGTDLSAGGWASLAIPGGAGVTVNADTPSEGIDEIIVSVPKNGEPRIFGRLGVTRAP